MTNLNTCIALLNNIISLNSFLAIVLATYVKRQIVVKYMKLSFLEL
jgi:hypothetical protein